MRFFNFLKFLSFFLIFEIFKIIFNFWDLLNFLRFFFNFWDFLKNFLIFLNFEFFFNILDFLIFKIVVLCRHIDIFITGDLKLRVMKGEAYLIYIYSTTVKIYDGYVTDSILRDQYRESGFLEIRAAVGTQYWWSLLLYCKYFQLRNLRPRWK